ncbi:MAG: 3,4-dihydroxy-2-butanone-4-phosphate synthase [Candidatus Magasanikbacteria bacterium RIFCSPHIGHO2_01_FULL_33_34]|uniref:3,4-dihydroxy-2-butanone 4-phosphate synthase n=1 Tax=Candidatus Magasanikbacteria bacterium RIFCSPHIGHO2_01_FULL_33_34 TaxID=1798671 RepID=A0A1F6LH76_9BACT|nr:MAG: 3,4-dihydroxy-2-butanone-4-phosphate synthase [Candidatus Magasanikbacteria bacterium RIFCSPHIGHO2_01_FULL_33_34]OGH66104.1 MAG: 3,4-dihydroxy-2-butanone-4-phosphate synthase [Candidatus Magasanikbacteria bacterium RIFCSPHIGHO2_02_FULL_33_17]OGH75950.1 MAG: 3,4-dihydroxy-2-butanone-4-phosphate synthase [Candidatus Magasanikbacteria bacterium RIFCSPLOWO2_01_FULL_33_34]OGH80948.1 MAG: 3,4-dihydroxy-2-butanone-4-phosphate synthase [Candidatus Magasanikbacteria bacterium RIFCSPLOWO2_12_FULL_
MKDSIQKAIVDLQAGKMIIIVDDENRENEGDLMMAGEFVTTEKMAFMIRYTGGVVCVPISSTIAKKFALAPMVDNSTDKFKTPFTVSVDSIKTKTGISALDRCVTIKTFVDDIAVVSDLSRPGHIFPLIAQDGGVKVRQGHTEASIELCKLAGLKPVAVISEMMMDDGSMMRGENLVRFAKENDLSLVSIAGILEYLK